MPDPHPHLQSANLSFSPEAAQGPRVPTFSPLLPFPEPTSSPLSQNQATEPFAHLKGLTQAAPARVSDRVFPVSVDELLERVATVTNLYRTGQLHEEARLLGISTQWLDAHFTEPPSVAMTEQQMALPTLFGKLDRFGSPAALARCLKSMSHIAGKLAEIHGSEAQISLGMRTSLDHAVTFRTITSGFFFVAPRVAPGTNVEKHQRAHLFSNADESRFRGAGYRDLTLSPDKLTAVEKIFAEVADFSQRSCHKASAALTKQETFNLSKQSRGEPVTDEMLSRVREQERQMLKHGDRASAAQAFLEDLRAARSESLTPDGKRISYHQFMEALNQRIAARFVPGMEFRTGYGEPINALATTGISDWNLFLSKFMRADILRADEPILRLRTTDSDGQPGYRILMLDSMTKSGVTVRDRDSGARYPIQELVDRSRQSLHEGQGPLLLPIACVRYAANYGMSGSVGLDDGMPYPLVKRVSAAFKNPEFTPFTRELNVFPYTRLVDFTPTSAEDPYHGFGVQYDVLDYYSFAQRINRTIAI